MGALFRGAGQGDHKGRGLGQFNGGQIFSYGNNVIFDNGVDGTPSAVIPLK